MTAPPAEVQAAALVATYQQSTQSLRDWMAGFITTLWRSLGTYRNADIPRFVSQAVPVVAGAQQQMASLTAAHLAQQQSVRLGTPFVPTYVDPAKVTGAAVRNGTTPAEVYERPFHLVWRQLDDLPRVPGSVEQAIDAGLDRAVQSAVTDLQLAKTHTSREVLKAAPKVLGYRRVLEGDYSCALCVVASTIRYHKADLMPMHPGCDCGTDPIFKGSDPGVAADDARLAAAHAAIAEQFGRSSAAARAIPGAFTPKGQLNYRDVLISHDHGELGPVLSVKGRPTKDLPKAKGAEPVQKGRTPAQIQAELTALERNLPRLTNDKQRAYMQQRLETLRQQLN